MTYSLFLRTSPSMPSGNHSNLRNRQDQVLVKDEVIFEESRDPYRALTEASQRMHDGKSVFFADHQMNQDQGSRDRAGIFSQN
ncbi:hypothetical protein ACIQUS_15740 [Pseudomonas sp. NPDC090755]|uniref:hypothetical protein n=1 Tax=Pseudomonas sp. NPDC090755 TaxID=3364481 RepID=UPI00383A7126